MKKVFLWSAMTLVGLVAAVAVLWSNLNTIIKQGIETVGPKVLQAQVTVDTVDIEVTEGRGAIRGLTIGNPRGFQADYAFKVGSIAVELDPASVTTDRVHIKSIVMDSPDMVYEGLIGKSNLEQLQANAVGFFGGGRQKPAKQVRIDYLKIANGTISVTAALLHGKKLTVPLPTIELRDIGKKKAVTMADALGQILGAINRAALPAVQKSLAALDQGMKAIGGAMQEGVAKGTEVLKELLGK